MFGRKVTAPIARSTAYDFNAQLTHSHLAACDRKKDTAIPCSVHPEVRDVMPHEILFQERSSYVPDSRMRGMTSLNGVNLNDVGGHGQGKVFKAVQEALRDHQVAPELRNTFQHGMTKSSTEGLVSLLLTDPVARKKANNAFTKFFKYVGVAITPCTSGSASALQRQGFSATRGGLMTVMNTGLGTIYAGQKVKMVLDVVDVMRQARGLDEMLDGVPREKILARLEPYDNDEIQSISTTVAELKTVQLKTPPVPIIAKS